VLGLLVQISCKGPGDTRTTIPEPAEATGSNSETFVLFFTGNWHGQLEPCGCSENQLGGIDRRSRFFKAVPASRRLLLDAGPLIDKYDRQSQLKLETFLYSFGLLQYDAIALTARELGIGQENIDLDQALRPPVVVTNMAAEAREKFGAVAYFEKTLQAGSNALDCLILALTEPDPLSGEQEAQQLNLQDTITALKENLMAQSISPDQPSRDRLVVLMLNNENEDLVKQLGQIPALDILVRMGFADEPEIIAPVSCGPLIITTGKLGKYLTRLDIPFDGVEDLEKVKFKTIAIKDTFPPDQSMVRLMDEYQMRLQLEELVAEYPRQQLPEGRYFTGNRSCSTKECHDHEDVYQAWSKFGHAQAMETLVRVNHQYDPECVSCHTVGMKYMGGYRSMELTPDWANVGCESCHGPGSAHVDDPLEEYQVIFTSCEACHDSEHSTNFDENREKYFKKINHWHEPRKYWK